MGRAAWNKMQGDQAKMKKLETAAKVEAQRKKAIEATLALAASKILPECKELTIDTKPKMVSRVVAKALGIPNQPEKLPKEILALVLEKMSDEMPDAELLERAPTPKEKLLVFAAAISNREANRKAAKAKILADKKAAKEAEAEIRREALRKEKEQKEAARLVVLEAEADRLEAIAPSPEPDLDSKDSLDYKGMGITDMRQPEVQLIKMSDKKLKQIQRKKAKAASMAASLGLGEAEITDKGLAKAKGRRGKLGASVAKARAQLALDLAAASVETARLRSELGGRGFKLNSIECDTFDLPNPGGGADLLTETSFIFVPGRRYGLIGRNGKGKSTLMKYVASRKVGGIDPAISIHYVNQELMLTAEHEEWMPVDVVLLAGIERNILMQEQRDLEALQTPTSEDTERLNSVLERLEVISADAARPRLRPCSWG